MRSRLLRAAADTVAVFAVVAALLGSGISLLLANLTHYRAELWHFIMIGASALALLVIAAIVHFSTRVYERRCMIRDCWNVVKDADTLDPDEDPAVDPDAISQKSIDDLTKEVIAELGEELPSERRRKTKKKMRVAIGAVAVAAPVALTGALIAMQKKLEVYKGKNTETIPVVKTEETNE